MSKGDGGSPKGGKLEKKKENFASLKKEV